MSAKSNIKEIFLKEFLIKKNLNQRKSVEF
jgi:hypothetical protein